MGRRDRKGSPREAAEESRGNGLRQGHDPIQGRLGGMRRGVCRL